MVLFDKPENVIPVPKSVIPTFKRKSITMIGPAAKIGAKIL